MARIVPDPNSLVDNDAVLRVGNLSGKSIPVSTIGGQAQFTIVSGSNPGLLRIEFFSDRADNNVANGISELIYNAAAVPVVFAVAERPLAIVSQELPDAYFGTPYAAFIEVDGGVAPYSFALRDGSELPLGLTLSETDGVISGIPLVAGSNFSFIVNVTDAVGVTVSRAYTINVNAAGGAALSITTDSLPDGTAGQDYIALVQATGGKPPYSWRCIAGCSGSSEGNAFTISITSPPEGARTVIIEVEDANGITDVRSYQITFAPAP